MMTSAHRLASSHISSRYVSVAPCLRCCLVLLALCSASSAHPDLICRHLGAVASDTLSASIGVCLCLPSAPNSCQAVVPPSRLWLIKLIILVCHVLGRSRLYLWWHSTGMRLLLIVVAQMCSAKSRGKAGDKLQDINLHYGPTQPLIVVTVLRSMIAPDVESDHGCSQTIEAQVHGRCNA